MLRIVFRSRLCLPKAFSDSQCFALSSALVSVYPMPRWIASFTSFASFRLDKLVLPKASLDSQCFALSSALVSVYPMPRWIANASHCLPLSSLFTQSLFNSKLCLLLCFIHSRQLTQASLWRCLKWIKPLNFRWEALYRGPERTIVRLGPIIYKLLYYSISIVYTLYYILCIKIYTYFVVPYVVPRIFTQIKIYGIFIKK